MYDHNDSCRRNDEDGAGSRPGAPGQVRIKVQACGVCHGDVFAQAYPKLIYFH
jgi:threonine dehydrogenase-like Zn-dependent dehydrogenase